MPDCWVVGPIAWDWPYRLDRLPPSGGVAHAQVLPGRLGGTGANVARALASRGQRVRMVGYVGDDEWGAQSRDDLAARGVDIEYVATFEVGTSQVLLLIEPHGERTIVSVVVDKLEHVRFPVERVTPGELVYFAGWRPGFEHVARELSGVGVTVASVPFPPGSEPVPVVYVIGSCTELPPSAAVDPYHRYVSWTGEAVAQVVLTRGADGVLQCDSRGTSNFDAIESNAVDSTGAGDAFAAAVLLAILEQRPLEAGVLEGLRWGAATAASSASVPVAWSEVPAEDERAG